jgi:hypothetical protein
MVRRIPPLSDQVKVANLPDFGRFFGFDPQMEKNQEMNCRITAWAKEIKLSSKKLTRALELEPHAALEMFWPLVVL